MKSHLIVSGVKFKRHELVGYGMQVKETKVMALLFIHPKSQEKLSFTTNLPQDIRNLIHMLELIEK